MKNVLGILFIFLMSTAVMFSQDCNCASNFQWMKKVFEENDAGFDYHIKQKSKAAYEVFNEKILHKAKAVQSDVGCQKVLEEWLHFFRHEHIGISQLNNQQEGNTKKKTNADIIKQFESWESIAVDVAEFKNYLQSKKVQDLEGVWASGKYEIGIKKVGETYIGFVIKADGVYWQKGQVKFTIDANDYSSTYYMRDHSQKAIDKVELIEDKYILFRSLMSLKRTFPETIVNEKVDSYYDLMKKQPPFLEKVGENTLYLRIPHFWYQFKKNIDSLVVANKELLLSAENLIIDIRNNGGGSTETYQSLLPFLYTNPIRSLGVEFLSTLQNNTMMDYIIAGPEFDEELKNYARKALVKLNANIGEFVNIDDEEVDILTFDVIHEYPKNIGIIIDGNVASASEQLLLDAKQSKKVKLFGATTVGALDLANVFSVVSPCEEFQLDYALSRSLRIPEMMIDEKGIQPDYYIDKSIPNYQWIEFVEEILNKIIN